MLQGVWTGQRCGHVIFGSVDVIQLAVAQGRQRHYLVFFKAGRLAEAVVRKEEIRFVLNDWAAQVAAKLIADQLGVGNSLQVIEVIVGGECRNAVEIEGLAVKIIRAAFGDEFQLAAGTGAKG